jgi:hypothetical protein
MSKQGTRDLGTGGAPMRLPYPVFCDCAWTKSTTFREIHNNAQKPRSTVAGKTRAVDVCATFPEANWPLLVRNPAGTGECRGVKNGKRMAELALLELAQVRVSNARKDWGEEQGKSGNRRVSFHSFPMKNYG